MGNNNPTVYLAYYDDLMQQIRFRWGQNDINNASDEGYNIFDQFADQRYSGRTSNAVFEPDTDYYSIVADGDGATGNTSGEFVDIAVKVGNSQAEDVIVMVWYDATNNRLMYSYKENPCNDNDYNSGNAGNSGYWSTPVTIMDEAGEYCKITVDYNGGIHIAAYHITNADLIYAYLPSYDSSSVSTCTVDSYSITGTNITLDTALSASGNVIPYIGYYMQSSIRPKFAYLVEPSGGFSTSAEHAPDGVDGDEFTGNWEVSMMPTTSRVLQDHVNVAVWKNSSGVITTSTTGTSSSGADDGTCWGNGTANPVLGYAIKVGTIGYLETAQKRD